MLNEFNQPIARTPKRFSFLSLIAKFLWVIFIIGLVVLAIALILLGFNLKPISGVYSGVNQGKTYLEESLTLAQKTEFTDANNKAKLAVKSFSDALAEVKKIRLGPLAYIPLANAYKTDVEHLVTAGGSLAEAMNQGTLYGSSLGAIIASKGSTSFSQLPITERQRILANIYNADSTLSGLDKKLEESFSNLNSISSFTWFGPLSTRLEELKDKIKTSRSTIEEASPLTRLLPSLLGYPNTAHYLLILQNSDELRPTGGFIGTYGIIQTKDGDFERFETHDIYHLDMPTKDKVSVTPPDPIKKYLGVDKWYMRDANWSPDWPTSAEKILWFYQQENSKMDKPDPISNFDGVIAITPELITDLMTLTGPVTVDKENYTAQNFVDLLQYKVEKGYVQLGTSSWQRKEVIGEIAKTMKQRLLDMPLSQWPALIRLISDNVARKNVLLYSRNPDLQKIIVEQGWSGEIRHDWGDFVMVVDANMAALKTDAVIDRQIDYKVVEENNVLKAKLVIRYSHSGGFDWKTTRYRTYTRVYVPAGAKLITASGFTKDQVTTGEEFGKTYFGAFLSVEPGQIGQLVFEYELPNSVMENMKKFNNYRLTIQKQPGRQVNKLAVDLVFKNEIKSYSPANFYSETKDHKQLKAGGDLRIDRSYFVNF
ncbi:MAG: DUF4012 domain-containing protein [Candidatus Falkowbacteria bacterium]|nr:DUF4012 domain-containing protein [Candidatus Falkowbacteria bacterium]